MSINSACVDQVIFYLHINFSLKDLGIRHYFLGIKVTYVESGIYLSLLKFMKKLLVVVGLNDSKPVNTLMTLGNYLAKLMDMCFMIQLNI